MARLSGSFDLTSKLRTPDMRLNITPFVDFCLLFVFFGMFSSSFVFSPGLSMHLPHTTSFANDGVEVSSVLIVRSDSMFLFEGKLHDGKSLEMELSKFVEKGGSEELYLLVKISADAHIQTLATVSEIANRAGFSGVKLAYEKADGSTPVTVTK